jgi:hypothetical protein
VKNGGKIATIVAIIGLAALTAAMASHQSPNPLKMATTPTFNIYAPKACVPMIEESLHGQKRYTVNKQEFDAFKQKLADCGGMMVMDTDEGK